MKKHIYSLFDEDLKQLQSDVFNMGELVVDQLATAVLALSRADDNLAVKIETTEAKINALDIKIEEACQQILAVRQPAAIDLRYILAISRMAHDLERAGDEAQKIFSLLKDTPEDYKTFQSKCLNTLSRDVALQLKLALAAFRDESVDAAASVIKGDKLVDQYYAENIHDTINMMQENPAGIDVFMNKIWALRGIERMGDHAINIAEQVIYLKLGKDVRHSSEAEVAEILENS